MRSVSRSLSSFLAAICVLSGVAIGATRLTGPSTAVAQQRTQKPATPAPAAPAPAAPTTHRTETTTYDSWTVTCTDVIVKNVAKVACSAVLSLQVVEQGQRRVLGAWVMGRNEEGALLTVLQTPQVQAGVLIQKGVDFKLGAAAPRKLSYVACSAQQCEASIVMDAAMIKEALAASSAVITIHVRDGRELNINMPTIAGIDKAVAALGR